MNNRYGINEKTERAMLPYGTNPRDILTLPEVEILTKRSTDALRTFIATICEVDESEITLNPDVTDYMFREIKSMLSRVQPGLKIVRPNVSKNTYNKRMQ